MIRASCGQKEPGEAMELFMPGHASKGDLLGIFAQLREGYPIEANIVAEYILDNPAEFLPKLVRQADEHLTGISSTPKGVTGYADTLRFIEVLEPGALVRIAFTQASAHLMRDFLKARHLIQIQEKDAEMFLMHCVVPSGRWDQLPRSYTARIMAEDSQEKSLVATICTQCFESISLVPATDLSGSKPAHVMSELISMRKDDFIYDEALFKEICRDLNLLQHAGYWIQELDPTSTVEDMLRVLPMVVAPCFTRMYFEKLDRMLLV